MSFNLNEMWKANKEFQPTVASTADKCLSSEKRVDIPIIDDSEFRKTLIERIEAVTLTIIKQIASEQLPYVSYSNGSGITKSSLREENNIPEYSSDTQQDTISYYDSLPQTCFTQQDTMSYYDYIDSSLPDCVDDQEKENQSNYQTSEKTTNFAIRGRRKFILMIMIMAEAHRLLLTNRTKTRRAFYYNLKTEETENLVPNQAYVDRALNDVAKLLECAPWDLKLLATAKGLVAGNMTMILVDGKIIDCTVPGGAQIPQILNVTSIRAKADFVLIVEKDAAFQLLLEEKCPSVLNCILVTGKGYPDTATRMLVKMLSEKMDLPVYAIVDAGPYGVDIMLLYRFGSSTFCKSDESLVCSNVRWLGIHPSELIALGAKTLPLTETDLTRLKSIEARSYVNDAISKQMSILRKGKAEIEAVSSFSKNFLTKTYLPCKIDSRDYI